MQIFGQSVKCAFSIPAADSAWTTAVDREGETGRGRREREWHFKNGGGGGGVGGGGGLTR